jgi:DNA polymerase-4
MDAFFVSVELLRRPELRGRPVVVGGAGDRGVVAAASYEARRYGVFSAMASARARRLCPELVFLPPDHAHYAEVSRQVQEHFRSVTPLVEPLALDEAFLDVTGALRLLGPAHEIAAGLRQRIRDDLGLTCSVGIASTKMLAKMASEAAKPRAERDRILPGVGIVEIRPGEELSFLHPRPVRALWGVGPATLAKLERLGVDTIGDLAALERGTVERILGRANGGHLWLLAQGIDPRPVEPDRVVKSHGHEETFATDRCTDDEVRAEVVRMADAVASRLRAAGVAARTVTLKVRFADFTTVTRSVTPGQPLDTGPGIVRALEPLLADVDPTPGIRLLGVSGSNLVQPALQLTLEPGSVDEAWSQVSGALDQIRERFGGSAITPGSALRSQESEDP